MGVRIWVGLELSDSRISSDSCFSGCKGPSAFSTHIICPCIRFKWMMLGIRRTGFRMTVVLHLKEGISARQPNATKFF